MLSSLIHFFFPPFPAFCLQLFGEIRVENQEAWFTSLSSACSSDLRDSSNELLLIMGAERNVSVVSRKSIGLNLHPVRFSCSQLFGMASGEDEEKQAAFSKLHSMLTMSTVHGRVYSEGRMWAWQVSRNPISEARKYLHMFELYVQLLKLYSHDLVFATLKLICYLNGFCLNLC